MKGFTTQTSFKEEIHTYIYIKYVKIWLYGLIFIIPLDLHCREFAFDERAALDKIYESNYDPKS